MKLLPIVCTIRIRFAVRDYPVGVLAGAHRSTNAPEDSAYSSISVSVISERSKSTVNDSPPEISLATLHVRR
jgi:hypothetical protein